MSMRMGGVTIDCAEPRALAEFWSKALGTSIDQDYGGEYVMLDRKPYVAFQRVPEKRAGKNRVHLDFATEDRAAEVSRLVGLGATEVAEHSVPGLTWTVLQDPEGQRVLRRLGARLTYSRTMLVLLPPSETRPTAATVRRWTWTRCLVRLSGFLCGRYVPANTAVIGLLVAECRHGTPEVPLVGTIRETGPSYFNKAHKGRLAAMVARAPREPSSVRGLIRMAGAAGFRLERTAEHALDLVVPD